MMISKEKKKGKLIALFFFLIDADKQKTNMEEEGDREKVERHHRYTGDNTVDYKRHSQELESNK